MGNSWDSVAKLANIPSGNIGNDTAVEAMAMYRFYSEFSELKWRIFAWLCKRLPEGNSNNSGL